MPYHDTELAALIEDGRVHRDVYTDKDVFELEMQRIFARTWVYVGHVSQIKEPGDYITTEIGRVPVVVVRHSDNGIHVIRNRCSHRGAKVAVGTHGHVDEFHCIFHGYTFKTDGTISAIPLEDAYTDTEFDRSDPRVNMQSVAAVDVYRGFVFARLQGGGPDLETWLGDSKISLDNITDRSPDGELECIGEPVRWINHCNWKMLVENIVDGAHVAAVHPSIAQTASRMAKSYEDPDAVPPILQMAQSFWKTPSWIRKMGTTILDNGHSYNGGKVSLHSELSDVADYLEAMKQAYGEQRSAEILSLQRHNTCIYPNVHIKCMVQKLRVFKPLAPDKTLTESWVFRLKGAPEEMLRRSIMYTQLLDSAATMVSNDDHEAMSRMQRGLQESSTSWVSLQRGRNRPMESTDTGTQCDGDSEVPFQHQFATWKHYMTNGAGE